MDNWNDKESTWLNVWAPLADVAICGMIIMLVIVVVISIRDVVQPKLSVFNLESEVLFDKGYATIKPEAFNRLDSLVVVIQNDVHYRRGDPYRVFVAGHSCIIPVGRKSDYKDNWELSAARALSVTRYFVKKGIDQKRIIANGYGEHQLLPDIEGNDPRNRRIEVRIIRSDGTI